MHSSHNKCLSCFTQTPWRAGPDGPKTLCDECGTRYIRRQLRIYRTPRGKLTARHSPRAAPAQILRFVHSDPLRPIAKILPRGPINGKCSSCGTSQSSPWRNGPDGPQTLCRDCGIKYGNFTLPLYQIGSTLVSAKPTAGTHVVRHVGFLTNGRGRDFMHPTFVPTDERAPQLGAPTLPTALIGTQQTQTVRLPSISSCISCSKVGLSLRTGPDGPRTLCTACSQLYVQLKLQLYQTTDGKLSLKGKSDTSPVKHVGFQSRLDGRRNLSKPRVVPINNITTSAGDDGVREKERDARNGDPIQSKCLLCATCEEENWFSGPDGPGTLCTQCAGLYAEKKVRLYMKEDGKVSVMGEEGSRHVHHHGFKKTAGKDDLLQPLVCPVEEANAVYEEAEEGIEGLDVDGTEHEEKTTSNFQLKRALAVSKIMNRNGETECVSMDALEADDNATSQGSAEAKGRDEIAVAEQQNGCEDLNHWDVEILIKAELNLEGVCVTRRFSIREKLSYEDFMVLVSGVFMIEGDVGLKYKDGEGDWVTMSSELEIRELYRECTEQGLRPVRLSLS